MAALKYPARLESNNPAAYGIVKANEISGHKTTNIAFLTSIPDAILSESGNNTNDDAIGQIWCTTDSEYGTLKYYKLTNWNKRNDYTGWKEIYALDDDFNSDIKGGLCRLVDLYDEKSNNKINVNLSAQYIKNGGVGFQTKTVTIPLASSTEIGLMSSADKTKLDSIQGNGGEDNVIESIKVNGTALPITDKSVDIPIETVDLSNYIQNSASDKDNQIRIASQDVILNSDFSTILVDSYGTTISSNENTNIICDKYRLALFDYYTGIILSNPDKTEKIEIGGGEAGNGNKFTRFTSNNLDFTNVKAFTGIKTINGQSILGTGNISIDFSFVEINTSLNNIQDPKENKLYLISSLQQGTDGSGNRSGITENNIYEEYIYVNGAFEKIGEVTSSIDLSQYYTKTETDNKISLNNTHLINTIKSSTKTINGTNIWGEGDITVNTDLSNYIGNVNITKTSIDSYNNNLQSKLSFNNNNSTLLYKVSNDTDETIASLTAHNNGISINTDDSDGNQQLNMNIDTKEIVFDTTLNSFNSNIIINPEYITIASNNLDLSQVKSVSGLKTINGKSILGNDNIIVPTLTSYEGTVDLRNSGRSSYGAIQLSNNTPKLFNNYGGTYESVEVTNEGPAIYNTNTDKTSGVIAKYNADNMYNKVISSDNTLTSELYIEENYTKLTGNYNGITTGCYVFTDEARTEIDSTDNTNKNQSSISVSNENIHIGSRNIVDNENTTSGIGIQQTKISLDTPNLDFTEVQSVTGLKTVNGQSILGNGNISTSYTLPIASDTVLGGVKVGAGLSINNGVLSANGGGTADAVDWSNVQNKPTFATVATSGSYNDLTDKPSIYTLPVANNESLGGVILGRETYSSLGEFTIIADSNNRIYTTIPYAKDGVLPNNLGLITKKDYTNFLENYDWYKSITGDDTDTIINKYQEIVNFLDTYTEADTLANILSNKADKTDVNSIAADVAALDADKADKTELATKADVEIVDALAANVNTLNTSKANQESVDLLDQKIDEVNNNKLDKPIDIYVWWNDYSRTYDIECKEYCLSKNKQNIKNLQLKTQNRFYFNTQCDVNVHYVYKEGTEFLTGDIHQACGIYNIDEDRILFNFYEIHTTGFTAENITAGFRYIKNTDTLEITQINPLGVDSKNNILYFDRFISYFSNNTTLEYNKSYTFDTSKEIPTSFDIESDKYISIDEMLNAVGHPDKIICSFENRDVTSRMQLLRTDNESTNNSSVYSTNYYSTPFNNNNTRLHIKISTGDIQNITVTFDNIHADTITSSEASTIANGAVIANENAKTTAKETILATVNNMVPTLFDLAGNNNRLKVKAIDVIADIPTVTGDGLWKILFCTFVDDQNVNKVYLVDKRDNDNIIHPEFYSYMHSSTIFDNTEGSASQGLSFFTLLIEENCDHQIFDYQTPA